MDNLILQFGLVLIPTLFALCFGALAYASFAALREGAESYAATYATDTARQLEDLFVFIPPRNLARAARLAAIACFFAGFLIFGDLISASGLLRGGLFGAVGAIAALAAPRALVHYLRRRRRERFNLQLVDALSALSNALRAGYSILQAIEAVVRERQNPIAQEFGMLLQQIRVGRRFEEALQNLEERVGSEDLSLMVRSIEIARQTGGNLTEVFDKISVTIRERMRVEGRIRALTSMGRLQGRVVGLMPFALLLLMTLVDPRMMNAFFASGMGRGLLLLMLALELAGALMIRKMTRIDV